MIWQLNHQSLWWVTNKSGKIGFVVFNLIFIKDKLAIFNMKGIIAMSLIVYFRIINVFPWQSTRWIFLVNNNIRFCPKKLVSAFHEKLSVLPGNHMFEKYRIENIVKIERSKFTLQRDVEMWMRFDQYSYMAILVVCYLASY